MKRTLIYSMCGCLLTSAATALTFYVDVSGSDKCAGTGFCMTNPGPGNCCTFGDTITKFNSNSSEGKLFDGGYIGNVKLIAADGTPISPKNMSTEEREAINTAFEAGGDDAKVNKIEIDDTGDQVVVTLDLKGGSYSGGTTLRLEDGDELPTGITRGDGAVLDYWYPANASESESNKVTEIDKSGGRSQSFVASYKCPETEGSEGRYYMNNNGTCVQNEGYYINGDTGQTMSPSQVSCYNNNGTPVYCYFYGTVRLHDKPTGSNLTVTNGNQGTAYQTLWCNRSFCRQGSSTGDFVSAINLPRTNGYTFRGYFLPPDQQVQVPGEPQIELITDHSTTAGEAFARFYPRSTANGVTSMTIYDVFDIIYVTTTPLPTSGYDIDLYGAWARDCATDTSLNPAGCLMRLGQTHNTNSYGLGKGDVRYDTECVGGKHVTDNSSGTYNPQCEDDTGDITFSYTFYNQYGETINCGSVTPSACTTGNNVSLVSQSNFNTACGSQYFLRYLNINNEWFRPSYQAGCNTNVFGQSGKVTIEGYACEPCKDDSAPEHGHCENMTSSGQINYNPINPDYYGVGSSGHSVGYGGLWGADPSGSNAYSACRTIVCAQGYQIWNNNGVKSCVTDYEACILKGNPQSECDAIGFSCPSSGYAPEANSHVTISAPSQSGTSCSYTIGCSAGVPYWTGPAVTSTVVTCQGSQCTSSWVQSQLNGKSCFVCPHYNGADWSVSPGVPTQSGFQCSYHILCNGRVACPRILKKDGVTIPQNSDYVTCDETQGIAGTSVTSHQCTSGWGTYQSLYFLTTEFGKYECVHDATNGSSVGCGGGTNPPEYTCPTTGLPIISNGGISVIDSTNPCYYQPTCNSGYTCNTQTQLCGEHACNNEATCNALFDQYRDHASDLCQEPIHVGCPNPTDASTLEHGSVSLADSNESRCTYEFECTESGYQLQGGSTAMCNRNNVSNLCSLNWLNSQIRSRSCQASGGGKGDDGEGGDGGDKEGGDTNSES